MRSPVADDVVAHIPELTRYALSLTRDRAAADDLLQETLARALSKLHLYEPSAPLLAWLFTIMRHLFIDARRQIQKRPESLFLEETHVQGSGDQMAHLVLQDLRHAISRLPPLQRTVLIAVVAHGWSYEQTSQRLGIAMGTVRSRLYRARMSLLQMLDPPSDARSGSRTDAAGDASF